MDTRRAPCWGSSQSRSFAARRGRVTAEIQVASMALLGSAEMHSNATSHLEMLQGLRVLLVEDNPGDADLIRDALADTGVLIDHVPRIAGALQRSSANAPDLILLDLGLPDAIGLDGLERLRNAMPSVPIVVLTNLEDTATGLAAVQQGAEDFVTKHEITGRVLRRIMCYAVERCRSRERETLLAAEQAKREEVQRASASKDRFLAVLSHELRNPLGPIRFALDILRNPGASTATIAQARNVMDRQVSQLVRLIDDLLDLSRMNQNKLKLRKEPTPLALVIESAVETVMPALSAAQLQLSLALPSCETVIDADYARVSQILVNLLHNAGKFTPAGGQIWLAAAAHGGEAVITVRDTGMGFPAEAAPRLFEMFHQESEGVHDKGGLGIGLTLAKELAELHGGAIEAHSEGRGAGAQFTVRLPLGVAQPLADSEASPRPIRVADEGALRVLIVDDNVDSADMLAILVRELGYETDVAYDPATALEIAQRFAPDFGLLDIGLPGMNGYELARRIRQLPGGARIKLVAITGWGQREDKRRAAEAGFDMHLTKPVAFQQLEALLLASDDCTPDACGSSPVPLDGARAGSLS
jgi:signal transduction histidine kinase